MTGFASDGPIERIIEAAYGAVLEPARWSDLVAAYVAAVGAVNGALHAPPTDGNLGQVFVMHNIDPTPVLDHISTHGRAAPFADRAAALGLTPGVFANHQVISYDEIRATAYYREYMRPMDMEHGLTAVLRQEHRPRLHRVSLSASRGRAAEPFGDHALGVAAHVFPHIRRAVALTLDVGPERMIDPAVADALEKFHTPCCLLDGGGRVMLANAAAREVMASDPSLAIREGRLASPHAATQAALDRAVGTACDLPAPWAERGAREVIVPQETGPPRVVVVTPLGQANPFAAMGRVRAAVYVLDGSPRPPKGSSERLRALYALTQAEAEIAASLIQGMSVARIAARRGVARSTVESQAKVILEKTQSARLIDLLRLGELVSVRGAS